MEAWLFIRACACGSPKESWDMVHVGAAVRRENRWRECRRIPRAGRRSSPREEKGKENEAIAGKSSGTTADKPRPDANRAAGANARGCKPTGATEQKNGKGRARKTEGCPAVPGQVRQDRNAPAKKRRDRKKNGKQQPAPQGSGESGVAVVAGASGETGSAALEAGAGAQVELATDQDGAQGKSRRRRRRGKKKRGESTTTGREATSS